MNTHIHIIEKQKYSKYKDRQMAAAGLANMSTSLTILIVTTTVTDY